MSALEKLGDTLLSEPLRDQEHIIVESFQDVECWLRSQFAATPPPFYCSTDLRTNGRKIVPVDTNLFPGGFNNLPEASRPVATAAVKRHMDGLCPEAKSILLVPEAHTRNPYYADNIVALKRIFENAGINVHLGGLGQDTELAPSSGPALAVPQIERKDNTLSVGGHEPCAILLNNDLSSGAPDILKGALTQAVAPPPALGWFARRKSQHFHHYERVAREFAEVVGADPWFFTPEFGTCNGVNLRKREGIDCLATAVDHVLGEIRRKYLEHGIEDEPFVVIKTDVGTYGMGVMTVRSPEDVTKLNNKQLRNLSTAKEQLEVRDILIQEGVRTTDIADGASAEPVIYMIGDAAVGGFYRVNRERGKDENLNSRGMSFLPLPSESLCCTPPYGDQHADHVALRIYVYGVIARLALLTAAREGAAPATEGI